MALLWDPDVWVHVRVPFLVKGYDMNWNTFRLAMEIFCVAHGTSIDMLDSGAEDLKLVLEIANKLQQHYPPGYVVE